MPMNVTVSNTTNTSNTVRVYKGIYLTLLLMGCFLPLSLMNMSTLILFVSLKIWAFFANFESAGDYFFLWDKLQIMHF